MTAVWVSSLVLVLLVLAVVGFGPSVAKRVRARRRRAGRSRRIAAYDPGRERRAERRARELLRSAAGPEAHAMYAELGFVHVPGPAEGGRSRYGYLIYPHRPIVAYDAETGELLSEYCVAFPDPSEPAHGWRLPAADDVLAKWMALRGDERGLITDANMHLPGRQHDPAHVRRDLRRLAEWEGRRGRARSPRPRRGRRARAAA